MDRIIKFRGKNQDIGWVYGQLAYDINGNTYIIQEVEIDTSYGLEENILFATMWYKVDKETVGQFTGLYDKNGKEIYEEDIVKVFVVDHYTRGYIKYNSSRGRFDVGWKTEIDKYLNNGFVGSCSTMYNEYDSLEVIGNIYDNKNLLKGEYIK